MFLLVCFDNCFFEGGVLYLYFLGGMRYFEFLEKSDDEIIRLIIIGLNEMLDYFVGIVFDFICIFWYKKVIF